MTVDDEASRSGTDDSAGSEGSGSGSVADETRSNSGAAGEDGTEEFSESEDGAADVVDSGPTSEESPLAEESDNNGDGGETDADLMNGQAEQSDGDANPTNSGQPSDSDYEGGSCPSTAPTLDEPCDGFGIFCTYGVGDMGCRERFSCHVTNVWSNSTIGGICLPIPADCATAPEGPCEEAGERCTQGESICSCRATQTESCNGGGDFFCEPIDPPIPQQWACVTPSVAEGCPSEIPNAGSRCDDETTRCLYGSYFAVCVDGYYQWERDVNP